MAKLVWDADGERLYETGVKNCALYVAESSGYGTGVAWNGITGVTESPSGAEETALYANDNKYLSLRSAEEFGGTIEAYTYPDKWMECDGSAKINGMVIGQQGRKTFALAYITTVGNDTLGNDYSEKLHIVYGATASPSERAYATINDSPEAITFSWEFSTVPVEVDIKDASGNQLKKTSVITIDKSDFAEAGAKAKYDKLKANLFGQDAKEASDGQEAKEDIEPTLLMPKQIYDILTA